MKKRRAKNKTDVVQRIRESIAVKQRMLESERYVATLYDVGLAIANAIRKGRKIFFFGNGGSASDAFHLAAELTGRYTRERKALPALALCENPSVLTAIGNDYGYDLIFSRQLEGLGQKSDVAVAISTSGDSPNVVRALRTARKLGMVSIGLTGESGGQLAKLADHCLCVPSQVVSRIQEAHITTGHIICEIVETELFG